MSFQDDALEPLTVESAQHFGEILRDLVPRQAAPGSAEPPPRRPEPRRALPRELGN